MIETFLINQNAKYYTIIFMTFTTHGCRTTNPEQEYSARSSNRLISGTPGAEVEGTDEIT